MCIRDSIRRRKDALLRTLAGQEGSIHAAHPSASLAPVSYHPLPRELRVGPCTCARSRQLRWLRVSLRGAAESAACTSAAWDPPEDDINQCFSPGLWQPPCFRSCACALGNKLQWLQCLLGAAPCPQVLLGSWGQMCPPPVGELEGEEMLLIPQ